MPLLLKRCDGPVLTLHPRHTKRPGLGRRSSILAVYKQAGVPGSLAAAGDILKQQVQLRIPSDSGDL